MRTIGIRELRQNTTNALRRVGAGETVGVTDRGRLVALLAPVSSATGAAALLAAGRVEPARRSIADLAPARPARLRTSDVLDDIRADR